VGHREDLAVEGFTLEETSFVDGPLAEDAPVEVQHRAHGEVNPGRVSIEDGTWTVRFDAPVLAIASGQSAALYSGDCLLGGGIISKTHFSSRNTGAYSGISAPENVV
jgi:tRNA-specific 2-thiouridylase